MRSREAQRRIGPAVDQQNRRPGALVGTGDDGGQRAAVGERGLVIPECFDAVFDCPPVESVTPTVEQTALAVLAGPGGGGRGPTAANRTPAIRSPTVSRTSRGTRGSGEVVIVVSFHRVTPESPRTTVTDWKNRPSLLSNGDAPSPRKMRPGCRWRTAGSRGSCATGRCIRPASRPPPPTARRAGAGRQCGPAGSARRSGADPGRLRHYPPHRPFGTGNGPAVQSAFDEWFGDERTLRRKGDEAFEAVEVRDRVAGTPEQEPVAVGLQFTELVDGFDVDPRRNTCGANLTISQCTRPAGFQRPRAG